MWLWRRLLVVRFAREYHFTVDNDAAIAAKPDEKSSVGAANPAELNAKTSPDARATGTDTGSQSGTARLDQSGARELFSVQQVSRAPLWRWSRGAR